MKTMRTQQIEETAWHAQMFHLGKYPLPHRVCHVEKLLSTIKTNCAMHQLFREREYLCDWNLESIEGRQKETYCLSVSSNNFISYSS